MSTASERYAIRYGVTPTDKLGDGQHGDVFETSRGNAVKFSYDPRAFERELRAYQKLKHLDVEELNGFQIPLLVDCDKELLAIEMTIVKPPFLIDFAASYTFAELERLNFSEETWAEREAEWADNFGSRWPTVRSLCNEFTLKTGLTLTDLTPSNIRFE